MLTNEDAFVKYYRVLVSRHTVETVSGTTYIRGSADGFDTPAIMSNFSLDGYQTFTMNFTGSNTEELATGSTYKSI